MQNRSIFTAIGLGLLALVSIALIQRMPTLSSAQQRTSDNELPETLSWMGNSYNPRADFGAYGHGTTGWYAPKDGRPYEEVLVSGSSERFTYNGCQMTLHSVDNRAAEVSKEVYGSYSYSFNLRDINPQSIMMKTISHTGGFYCEAFPDANMDCDHAEIVFKTRLEAPLIDMYSDVIYPQLQGSDLESKGISKAKTAYYAKALMRAFDMYSDVIYPQLQGDLESKGSSKANTAYFNVDNVEYAKGLMRAFRHAVELCVGKPEPFGADLGRRP
jgi:hypothetical protein